MHLLIGYISVLGMLTGLHVGVKADLYFIQVVLHNLHSLC